MSVETSPIAPGAVEEGEWGNRELEERPWFSWALDLTTERRWWRYSAADVARIATLACLKATGMPLDQMRRYFELSSRGQSAAPALRDLLKTQRGVLEARLEQMRCHLEYVDRKIAYWGAVEAGDDSGAREIARELDRCIREYGRRPRPESEAAAGR